MADEWRESFWGLVIAAAASADLALVVGRDLRDDRPSAGGGRRKRRHRSVLDPRNLLVFFVLATCFASMLWMYSRFTKLP